MTAPTLTCDKFQQLLRYLDAVGIDAKAVSQEAGLDAVAIELADATSRLPALHYSRLYKQAVLALQAINSRVPWAAGVGTDAFEMLCRAIIGSGTLGEALERAERFSMVLEPITGNRVTLTHHGERVRLHYQWTADEITSLFAPEHWYRSTGAKAVMLTSGLLVWHGLLSWLLGQPLKAEAAAIAGQSVSEGYADAVSSVMTVRPCFDATDTYLEIASAALHYRVVQNHESLQSFLDESVLQLIKIEQRPASVGEAVKRLLGNDFRAGMPGFSEIATRLHMSESSLRRRLLDEETSFQVLKDELRCDLAKHYLAEPDARLGDIAERLGFTEPSSFGRSFRQWTGMTPSTWRRQAMVRIEADANPAVKLSVTDVVHQHDGFGCSQSQRRDITFLNENYN